MTKRAEDVQWPTVLILGKQMRNVNGSSFWHLERRLVEDIRSRLACAPRQRHIGSNKV